MNLPPYLLNGVSVSVICLLLSLPLAAQQSAHLEIESPFGSFVESEFPFFTQTLDAREFGENPEPTNLTPRGIIVKLGGDYYGCFDPDLLRWSLVWKANEEGEYLSMDGMAPGSYRLPNRKAPAGQNTLPKPVGTPLMATAALPGWYPGTDHQTGDPRERGNSEEGEIGIGPVSAEIGRFEGLDISGPYLTLVYQVGDVRLRETPQIEQLDEGGIRFRRDFTVEDAIKHPVSLRRYTGDYYISWNALPSEETNEWMIIQAESFLIGLDDKAGDSIPEPGKETPEKRWPETITLPTPEQGISDAAFVFDDLPLPVPNPWQRNVRLAGFDFFPDGRAAFCTFDGDVWIAEGLAEGRETTTWSRFASGLHEPKTVCIVDEEIYISDRNGIVCLKDTDGNGEADWYENFSNIVPQTAETREFAMDMVAAKGGGFYLAKGGQVGSTRGVANGTIVRISADGLAYDVIATGLRQPYLGYRKADDLITASDQQGHWKPATPIYRIEAGKYYGFQPAKLKEKAVHPAAIAPPEIWIPHFINQSGASQVWLDEPASMGTLNGSLIHIGFNRPELFKVYLDDQRSQGAVAPLISGFPAGLLKGRVNPADGRLYVCGFEIWGSSGDRISGLFRVRPGEGKDFTPTGIKATARGVMLSFRQPLSEELCRELGRYSVDRWNYQQTHHYGSGNFRLDGEPGQESVPISSATLSEDGKSLFIGLPDMKPSHSLRVTYRLPHPEVESIDSVYLTVHSLQKFDLTEHGFETNEIDLTPPLAVASAGKEITPSAALGKEVSMRYGCIACHANGEAPTAAPVGEGSALAVGPAWTGLWKSRREFTDGSFIKNVDETYLRESILDPGRRVAAGYATEKTGVGMPSYLGVLKDHEIESIILYIKDLK